MWVEAGGMVRNVQLKREPKGEKKIGNWRWSQNPFPGTRELNGLRVMMALINNWDLKDENNGIFKEKEKDGEALIYMVNDLGSSFGTAGPSWPHEKAKGNLESYAKSKFIINITPESTDFAEPAKPH